MFAGSMQPAESGEAEGIMNARALAALALTVALYNVAGAQETGAGAATPQPVAATPGAVAPVPAPAPHRVKLREGTEVPLVFVDQVSSATAGEGDRINLRVDEPIKMDGVTVIPAGAPAIGTVTGAHKKGFMGKAGDLNLVLNYVKVGDERVRLRGNRGKEGDGKLGTTVTLTVLFGPLGLLKRGHDVVIKAGSPITAFVDQDVDLLVSP